MYVMRNNDGEQRKQLMIVKNEMKDKKKITRTSKGGTANLVFKWLYALAVVMTSDKRSAYVE